MTFRLLYLVVAALLLPLANGSAQPWTQHEVTDPPFQPVGVGLGDVDGDGDLDILSGSRHEELIAWWENLDNGTAWVVDSIAVYYDGLAELRVADLDSDGDPDLVTIANLEWPTYDSVLTWWETVSAGQPSWVERVIHGSDEYLRRIHLADINEDGNTDIVELSNTQLLWWDNFTGEGMGWQDVSIATVSDWHPPLSTGDIDGDGDRDVLGTEHADYGRLWIENLEGDGSLWAGHSLLDYQEHYLVADFDGDGDNDLLSCEFAVILWLENVDGSGSEWAEHVIHVNFSATREFMAVDLDGDGDLDIVGTSFGSGEVAWWENAEGDASQWIHHPLNEDLYQARYLDVGDMDNDGDLDVVATAPAGLYWWEQPGAPPAFDLTLTAESTPLLVERGDLFNYDIEVAYARPFPAQATVWIEAVLPNNTVYGPVSDTSFVFQPGQVYTQTDVLQSVPSNAPLGVYQWMLNAQINTDSTRVSTAFPFIVHNGIAPSDSMGVGGR